MVSIEAEGGASVVAFTPLVCGVLVVVMAAFVIVVDPDTFIVVVVVGS